MAKLTKYRVLIAGILSPPAAVALLVCLGVYMERGNSRSFRLSALTLSFAMVLATIVPFLVAAVLAIRDRRRLSLPAKLGLVVALLSLAIPLKLAPNAFSIWKQPRNMAMRDVPAPQFATLDLDGKTQSLSDQKNKVVLVNVWATWCMACRAEMPKLDRLYQEHKGEGLIVFGLSNEDAATQRKCLDQIPVSYPLLTYKGEIPAFYREVAAYPVTFLIDRRGRLQPAFGGDQSMDKLETGCCPPQGRSWLGGGQVGRSGPKRVVF